MVNIVHSGTSESNLHQFYPLKMIEDAVLIYLSVMKVKIGAGSRWVVSPFKTT